MAQPGTVRLGAHYSTWVELAVTRMLAVEPNTEHKMRSMTAYGVVNNISSCPLSAKAESLVHKSDESTKLLEAERGTHVRTTR